MSPLRELLNKTHSLRVLARAGMVVPASLPTSLRAMREVPAWGPLVTAVRRTARLTPDALAVVDERGAVTYRELHRRSTALARGLRAAGLRPEHVVGVLCRNHRGFVEVVLACAQLGVRVVLLDTGFAVPQVLDVVRREEIAAVVHDEEFAPLLERLPVGVARWVSRAATRRGDAPALADLVAEAGDRPLEEPLRAGTVVLLTSGTTGAPRGARREISSILTAADFLDRVPLRAGEATFIAAPLFHAVGFSHLTLAFSLGSTAVVHREFDPDRVVRAVARRRCTALVVVPAMLQRIVELAPERLGFFDLSRLRVVFCSGANLSPELATRAMNVLGEVLYNFYGSTEVAVATVATPRELRAAPGTVGRSPRNCRVRLYTADDREITRPHVVGRVFVSGSPAFSGYTDGGRGRTIGGLVSTGDLGRFDDEGRLFLSGREDDVIVSGGEDVHPREVEDLLVTHDRVRDAVVVGVPDEEFGQCLRAFVVPVSGACLDVAELREFVRARLARHKVPREVVLLPVLPHNATGKVVRRHLPSPRGTGPVRRNRA